MAHDSGVPWHPASSAPIRFTQRFTGHRGASCAHPARRSGRAWKWGRRLCSVLCAPFSIDIDAVTIRSPPWACVELFQFARFSSLLSLAMTSTGRIAPRRHTGEEIEMRCLPPGCSGIDLIAQPRHPHLPFLDAQAAHGVLPCSAQEHPAFVVRRERDEVAHGQQLDAHVRRCSLTSRIHGLRRHEPSTASRRVRKERRCLQKGAIEAADYRLRATSCKWPSRKRAAALIIIFSGCRVRLQGCKY